MQKSDVGSVTKTHSLYNLILQPQLSLHAPNYPTHFETTANTHPLIIAISKHLLHHITNTAIYNLISEHLPVNFN